MFRGRLRCSAGVGRARLRVPTAVGDQVGCDVMVRVSIDEADGSELSLSIFAQVRCAAFARNGAAVGSCNAADCCVGQIVLRFRDAQLGKFVTTDRISPVASMRDRSDKRSLALCVNSLASSWRAGKKTVLSPCLRVDPRRSAFGQRSRPSAGRETPSISVTIRGNAPPGVTCQLFPASRQG